MLAGHDPGQAPQRALAEILPAGAVPAADGHGPQPGRVRGEGLGQQLGAAHQAPGGVQRVGGDLLRPARWGQDQHGVVRAQLFGLGREGFEVGDGHHPDPLGLERGLDGGPDRRVGSLGEQADRAQAGPFAAELDRRPAQGVHEPARVDRRAQVPVQPAESQAPDTAVGRAVGRPHGDVHGVVVACVAQRDVHDRLGAELAVQGEPLEVGRHPQRRLAAEEQRGEGEDGVDQRGPRGGGIDVRVGERAEPGDQLARAAHQGVDAPGESDVRDADLVQVAHHGAGLQRLGAPGLGRGRVGHVP